MEHLPTTNASSLIQPLDNELISSVITSMHLTKCHPFHEPVILYFNFNTSLQKRLSVTMSFTAHMKSPYVQIFDIYLRVLCVALDKALFYDI